MVIEDTYDKSMPVTSCKNRASMTVLKSCTVLLVGICARFGEKIASSPRARKAGRRACKRSDGCSGVFGSQSSAPAVGLRPRVRQSTKRGE